MKRLTFIIFFAFVVIIAGCRKKEYPKSVDENQVLFYFKGDVDNAPTVLEAGLEDYYMYSKHSSSDSLLIFEGDLRQLNCTTCKPAISISINNCVAGNDFVPGKSLFTGKYVYNETLLNEVFVLAMGSSVKNQQSPLIRWDFGDGKTSTGVNSVHEFSRPGRYNICVTSTGKNGCTSSICNIVNIKQNPCLTSISSQVTADSALSFSHSTRGTPPFKFFWSFGDGKFDTSSAPFHYYKIPGSYPVSLTVIDSKNDTAVAKYNAITHKDSSSCAINVGIQALYKIPNRRFSNVTVRWTDTNGSVYTSADVTQPLNAFFEVMNVEEFDRNEKGERTKKITVRFNCLVSNGVKTISLNNAEAAFCVAYP